MLKKLVKIVMLAGALIVTCTANAQDTETATNCDYPHYGIWSNWSIGGKLMLDWEPHGSPLNSNSVVLSPLKITEGSNIGLGLFLQKDISHQWALRLVVEQSGLLPVKDWQTTDNLLSYDRWWKIGIDAKYNFVDKCYQNAKPNYWYLLAGVGLAVDFIDSDNQTPIVGGTVGEYIHVGLGYNWQVSDKTSWFAEAGVDIAADAPAPWSTLHHTFFNLGGGFRYGFGITAEDQEIQEQRSKLTQENFDKKDDTIRALRTDNGKLRGRENELMRRVSELEEAARNLVPRNSAVEDSLRAVINGYETNKHNFYALPFSILYPVDQYTVPADQMKKVKAIADVMKSTDCNFEIIGYCDYSGSETYNQKLSERRAEYVKKLLVERYGIDPDRLTTSGKGKSMAFGDIKNAVNRRTSFYRVNK